MTSSRDTTQTPPHANQAATWNDRGDAHPWVALQGVLDGLFVAFEHQLAETAAAHQGARVLDIGCGTGATTVAAARAVGDGGRATGVDVAAAMIDAARARTAREGVDATFAVGDAQTHPFEAGAADLLISRFGVMFFADPVAAFANLLRAATPGAPLELITWRTPAENPFMTTAERAAAPLLPGVFPERRAGEQGQFGLAEREPVQAILRSAGWQAPSLAPLDLPCAMPLDQLAPYVTQLGPVGMHLTTADAATRTAVIPSVLDAFAPYVDGDMVRFTAACWTVRATAPLSES